MGSATAPIQGWEKRVRVIEACRICGSSDLRPVIDLGAQCLAGLFDDGRPQNQLTTPVPLEVICCGGDCGFIQLRHTVPPDVMFQDYGYRSGINSTMKRHLEQLALQAESAAGLVPGDLVVDIGANDGTLLSAYSTPGLSKIAFEPSDVRPAHDDHGIHYIPTFFSQPHFHEAFPGRQAKLVTAIAMFYDIDDPAAFCRQVHEILETQGRWILEMHYWGSVLEQAGFDAICHEHLGYYSLSTLKYLMSACGFEFADVSFNSSNGGSVRCTLQKAGRPVDDPARRRIEQAFAGERENQVHSPERHARFRAAAERIRAGTLEIIRKAGREGKSVYGYGASTKGNVLLQYCGLTSRQITAIADRNPLKKGRFTPGSRLPICTEEAMRRAKPDYLLVLPWHFLPEFIEREKDLRSGGTRFIVPFPEPRVV